MLNKRFDRGLLSTDVDLRVDTGNINSNSAQDLINHMGDQNSMRRSRDILGGPTK